MLVELNNRSAGVQAREEGWELVLRTSASEGSSGKKGEVKIPSRRLAPSFYVYP